MHRPPGIVHFSINWCCKKFGHFIDLEKTARFNARNMLNAFLLFPTENEEEKLESVAPPPKLPPRPSLPVSSKDQLRAKVIDELVFTERDFQHQMELCSNKVLPALKLVSIIVEDLIEHCGLSTFPCAGARYPDRCAVWEHGRGE